MTKEEIENNLKNYKKNKASILIKERQLSRIKKNLFNLQNEVAETSITSSVGLNCDIRSKNNVSDKITNALIKKEENIKMYEQRIKELKEEINDLKDIVEDTKIRIDSLAYKERKIIEAYFFEKKSAEEIGNILYFKLFRQTRNQRTIYNLIESTLEEMSKI